MWCEEFSPETFAEQTAATFAASLKGRANRRKYNVESDISLAWHTAAFSGAAQNGKLKALASYLGTEKKSQTPDEMLKTLEAMRDMGAPMDIQKIN